MNKNKKHLWFLLDSFLNGTKLKISGKINVYRRDDNIINLVLYGFDINIHHHELNGELFGCFITVKASDHTHIVDLTEEQVSGITMLFLEAGRNT